MAFENRSKFVWYIISYKHYKFKCVFFKQMTKVFIEQIFQFLQTVLLRVQCCITPTAFSSYFIDKN